MQCNNPVSLLSVRRGDLYHCNCVEQMPTSRKTLHQKWPCVVNTTLIKNVRHLEDEQNLFPPNLDGNKNMPSVKITSYQWVKFLMQMAANGFQIQYINSTRVVVLLRVL